MQKLDLETFSTWKKPGLVEVLVKTLSEKKWENQMEE